MKLGHIVKYHDVFIKFDNGLYRIVLSAVVALCLWKFTVLNDVRILSPHSKSNSFGQNFMKLCHIV